MAIATLTVKNISGGALTVTHDDGVQNVVIADGQNEQLSGEFLLSEDFRTKLMDGDVRFVLNPLTAPRVTLARIVFPRILEDLGSRVLGLRANLKHSRDALAADRVGYNARHKVTKQLLQDGDTAGDGTDFLAKGASHWLNAKPEQAAVDAALAAIAAHQQVNVPADMTFQDWYDQLLVLQATLARKRIGLANAKALYVDDYAHVIQNLTAAAVEFGAIQPATDVGNEIPAW